MSTQFSNNAQGKSALATIASKFGFGQSGFIKKLTSGNNDNGASMFSKSQRDFEGDPMSAADPQLAILQQYSKAMKEYQMTQQAMSNASSY